MPYGLVLLVAAGWLAFRHAVGSRVSSRSKWAVVGAVVGSLFVAPFGPLVGMAMQLAVCVYVIFHKIVVDALAEETDRTN
jgi:hypothetical protein